MEPHSLLPLLDHSKTIVFIFLGVQILFILFKVDAEIVLALGKSFFYLMLAWSIYHYSHKVGLRSDNYQDYLTLFTFILSLFEGVQNALTIFRLTLGKIIRNISNELFEKTPKTTCYFFGNEVYEMEEVKELQQEVSQIKERLSSGRKYNCKGRTED